MPTKCWDHHRRRRRNSQRPACNGMDMTKVRQEKPPTQVDLNRPKRRRDIARAWSTYKTGLRPCRGRVQSESQERSTESRVPRKWPARVWSGGKAVRPYLSLHGIKRVDVKASLDITSALFCFVPL